MLRDIVWRGFCIHFAYIDRPGGALQPSTAPVGRKRHHSPTARPKTRPLVLGGNSKEALSLRRVTRLRSAGCRTAGFHHPGDGADGTRSALGASSPYSLGWGRRMDHPDMLAALLRARGWQLSAQKSAP
jgi:hypothetical protein